MHRGAKFTKTGLTWGIAGAAFCGLAIVAAIVILAPPAAQADRPEATSQEEKEERAEEQHAPGPPGTTGQVPLVGAEQMASQLGRALDALEASGDDLSLRVASTARAEGDTPAAFEIPAELKFPNKRLKDAEIAFHRNIEWGSGDQWEPGISDMILVTSWECSWLNFASEAAQAGDTQKLITAGNNLSMMRDIAGYQKYFPDLESYLADTAEPLKRGDASNIEELAANQCGGR